jgi:hypothetical protein
MVPKPRNAFLPLLKVGFGMLLASQVTAAAVYFGLNWRQELFIARANRTEATLLGVNPDQNGYRVQVAYTVSGHINRTSVIVRDPPAIPLGEKLDIYVDPSNFWKVAIVGPPSLSLGFLLIGCAGFAALFFFFMILGALATSTAPMQPQEFLSEEKKSA